MHAFLSKLNFVQPSKCTASPAEPVQASSVSGPSLVGMRADDYNVKHADDDRPYRILLIEDDRSMRMFAKTFLSRFGDVLTASNLSHGVTKYMVMEPDIIFIDIGLPDGDGYQILDFIMYSHPEAYVVMYSGLEYDEHALKAKQLGAKGFVPKSSFMQDVLPHLRASGADMTKVDS